MKSPSITVDRAEYYTPSGCKCQFIVNFKTRVSDFSPTGKLEKIEEYRLIREESTLSRESGSKPTESAGRFEDRIIRTTTTQHNQQVLRPATYI